MKNRNLVLAFLFILGITVIIFRQFFFRALLPIPSDIITGVYYPWLNQKWGTQTGVPVKNPLPSDIPSLVYPWRLQVRQQIYQGQFPLWNDQIFSGMPLFGNFQSSVLSLSNLLFLPIRDHSLAWSLGVIFQPILMFLSAYLFLRKIKLSQLSSLFGSLVYAFNGFSVVWMEYNLHGWALMWLPLLLYSIESISGKNKWGYLLLSLSVAGSIFSGYPQLTLYSFLITAIYGFYKLIIKQISPKQILIIGLFAFLGLGISAVQLATGYETAGLSIRSVDTVAITTETRFLPLEYLTNLFAPDLQGNPATGNYFGRGFYDNFSIYVGMTSLILSLISMISFRSHKNLNLLSLLLIIIGISLSTDNIFGITISDLNIFGIKSIAARAMIISIVGLVIMSSTGLEVIAKSIKIKSLISPLLFLGLTATIYLQVTNPISKRNLILPIAISLVITFTLMIGKLFKKINLLIPYAFLLVLFFEIFRFSDKYLSFTPKSYLFPDTPIIKTLQNQPDIGISKVETSKVIPENMWVPYGLKSAVGYDATAPLRYSRLLGMIGNKDLSHTQGRVGKIDQVNQVSNLLGVNYILTFKKTNDVPDPNGKVSPDFDLPKYSLVDSEGPVVLYKIKDSPKIIDFYTKSFGYQNDEEFIKIVNNSSYQASSTALIYQGQTANNPRSNTKLEVKENLPGRISVTTDSSVPGYVVFKENFYPGWQAVVDGKVTEIKKADYAYMGVFLDSGRHSITFSYEPSSFRLGMLITIISSIVYLILLKLTWKL